MKIRFNQADCQIELIDSREMTNDVLIFPDFEYIRNTKTSIWEADLTDNARLKIARFLLNNLEI